jgi:hypothetical protein
MKSMKALKTLVWATACLFSAGASAACYTVLNKDGKTIYQASSTPVDLAYPLHETVPARFGAGTSMVFALDVLPNDCVEVGVTRDVEAVRGDNVMSTVFANVRTLQRPPTNSAVPAMTYPNTGSSAKTAQ